MKLTKKIITGALSTIMILSAGLTMTACFDNDDDAGSKVMNLSINPSIELILDGEENVVSVSANNDEGNFIIANATFVGLEADDAVELFLEVTNENGFIDTTATASKNELKIEISGEHADEVFKDVKESALEYLEEAQINVNIKKIELDNKYIKDLVLECMQELEEKDLENKTETELIDMLNKSRQETKDMFSEELKKLYYESRAEEILKEKFDAIKTQLDSISIPTLDQTKQLFDDKFSELTTKLDEFKAKYEEIYLSAEGEYQKAMQAYIDAKQALLEARISNQTENLEELETALNEAKLALDELKTAADQTMEVIKTTMDTIKDAINNMFNIIEPFLNKETINNAVNEAKNNYATQFKNNYNDHIQNKQWDDLKPKNSK